MEEDMKKIQMEVIPEPEPGTASVLVLDKKGSYAIIRGVGDIDYVCGVCRNVICERVERGQIMNMVFRCPQCGSFNALRGT
jgi:predicted RNA-binding Zn-ribbon protein involved in translation (DUF1610 family)